MIYSFEFPYPPSVNHYWGQSGKRRFITKRGMEFREKVSDVVADLKLQTISSEVHVFVRLFPPDKRRRDVDNPSKALLDAMEHAGVYEDDCQISKLVLERGEVIKGGLCRVIVLENR